MRRQLHETEETVRNNLKSALKKQADYYNKRNLSKAFKVGDFVFVRQSRKQKSFKKFNYHGPYEIIRKLGEWTYELKDPENDDTIRRSYNQIKRYQIPITFNVEHKESLERCDETCRDVDIEEEADNIRDEDSDNNAGENDEVVSPNNQTSGIRKGSRTRNQPCRLGFPSKPEAQKYLAIVDYNISV